MNQKQRKRIAALSAQLQAIYDEFETMGSEEQDKLDNLPESLQSSSKADEYQEAIDAITEAVDSIQAAIDAVDLI